MADRSPRLGDVIDDYCPRCRLLLNHDVTSLFGEVPAKRKSSRQPDKKSLMDQVLASMPKPPEPPLAPSAARPQKRDLWAEVERLKGRKGPA